MSTVTVIALVAPLVWVGWQVLTDWVAMPPLNDLPSRDRRQRVVSAATTYPIGLLVAAGVLVDETWSLVVALVLAASVVVGHLAGWWLPYAGISVRPQRTIYRREYAHTLRVLPDAGHAVVVDVQHMVTGVLGVVMLVTTWLALVA
jgi:hypothetical protein